MKLPLELIKYILSIKSYTAWQNMKKLTHTKLLAVFHPVEESDERIRIYPSRQTTNFSTRFFNFEVSETRGQTSITRFVFIYTPRVKVWIPPPEEFGISFPRRDFIWALPPNEFTLFFLSAFASYDHFYDNDDSDSS